MGGNLNAAGILIIVFLTVLTLVRFGRQPTGIKRVASGIMIGLLLFLVFSIVAPALGGEEANRQVLIPCVCLSLVFIFTGGQKSAPAAQKSIFFANLLIMMLASFSFGQYYYLVDTDAYTGKPAWKKAFHEKRTEGKLWQIRKILSNAAQTDDTIYPSGWLSDLEMKNLIPQTRSKELLNDKKCLGIRGFWHTPLTGLYGVKYRPAHVWYPGGRLKGSLDSLEFREKTIAENI